MRKVLREVFSGANGKLSAKRVIGGVAMAVALGCTIGLVVRDGSNSVVENLLMTIFITSVSLLGLPAITGAWGTSKIQIPENKQSVPENKPEVPETPPITPSCETCEYKYKQKGTV